MSYEAKIKVEAEVNFFLKVLCKNTASRGCLFLGSSTCQANPCFLYHSSFYDSCLHLSLIRPLKLYLPEGLIQNSDPILETFNPMCKVFFCLLGNILIRQRIRIYSYHSLFSSGTHIFISTTHVRHLFHPNIFKISTKYIINVRLKNLIQISSAQQFQISSSKSFKSCVSQTLSMIHSGAKFISIGTSVKSENMLFTTNTMMEQPSKYRHLL